jgi:hypothetical protein
VTKEVLQKNRIKPQAPRGHPYFDIAIVRTYGVVMPSADPKETCADWNTNAPSVNQAATTERLTEMGTCFTPANVIFVCYENKPKIEILCRSFYCHGYMVTISQLKILFYNKKFQKKNMYNQLFELM